MHGRIPDMVGKPELRHFLIPKPKRKAMHNPTESPPKKEDRSEKVSRCIRQIWNGGQKVEHHDMNFIQFFHFPFVPECVARVPVSLWGSGG